MERKVTFQGNPLTLVGRNIAVNLPAANFTVHTVDLKPFTLLDLKDTIKILTTFPSIDTPVCDLQVKEFNRRATSMSSSVVIAGISKDLPFAQKRFCDTNNIKNVITLSDYATSSFGLNYGLLIKELNLLGRAVIILDKNNIIRYLQIVNEITQAPNFDEVVINLEKIVKHPSTAQNSQTSHCLPCQAGLPPIAKEKIAVSIKEVKNWQLIDDKKISKEFTFGTFNEAKYFLDMVALIAQEQGHHPSMLLSYNKLKIILTTHASGGLTDNDFIMAKIIDELNG